MTTEQLLNDFKEALDLLQVAAPNLLLIRESEYWDRYAKLTDRYFEPEEDEDEEDLDEWDDIDEEDDEDF